MWECDIFSFIVNANNIIQLWIKTSKLISSFDVDDIISWLGREACLVLGDQWGLKWGWPPSLTCCYITHRLGKTMRSLTFFYYCGDFSHSYLFEIVILNPYHWCLGYFRSTRYIDCFFSFSFLNEGGTNTSRGRAQIHDPIRSKWVLILVEKMMD